MACHFGSLAESRTDVIVGPVNANILRAQAPRLVEGAVVCLAFTLFTVSLAAAPRRPPSSLQTLSAVIHFRHSHERVASCSFQPDTLTCNPRTVAAPAAIDFSLTPAPDQLVSKPGLQRQPLNISLPTGRGTVSLEVRVETGNWTLSWADQRAVFHVVARRDFGVQLGTTSGACIFEAGQCRRHDELVTRSVLIPTELRGAE